MRLRYGIALGITMALLAACGDDDSSTSSDGSGSSGDGPSVGITQFATIPPLDGLREAFVERMNEEYGEDGWSYEYLPAEGEVGNTAPIAQQLAAGGHDIYLAIATASAQALHDQVQDEPIVFGAVADPVGAGIRESDEGDDGNVTGVSSLGPLKEQMELIIDSVPDVETFGFIYNDAEQNAVYQADVAEAALEDLGDYEVVRATASTSAEVSGGASQLASQADVMWFPASSTALEGLPALVQVAQRSDTPLFCADTTAVEPASPGDDPPGCLGTVGFSFPRSGEIAADLVIRVLEGEDPGAIPTVFVEADTTVVNACAAEQAEFEFPESVLSEATDVVECG